MCGHRSWNTCHKVDWGWVGREVVGPRVGRTTMPSPRVSVKYIIYITYGVPFLSVWIHITASSFQPPYQGTWITFAVVLNRPIWLIWLRDWCIYYMSIWRGCQARERSIKFGPISRRVNISFICPHALVWLFPPKSIFLPICRFAVYSAYNIGTGEPCKISAPVSGIVSGTI